HDVVPVKVGVAGSRVNAAVRHQSRKDHSLDAAGAEHQVELGVIERIESVLYDLVLAWARLEPRVERTCGIVALAVEAAAVPVQALEHRVAHVVAVIDRADMDYARAVPPGVFQKVSDP